MIFFKKTEFGNKFMKFEKGSQIFKKYSNLKKVHAFDKELKRKNKEKIKKKKKPGQKPSETERPTTHKKTSRETSQNRRGFLKK